MAASRNGHRAVVELLNGKGANVQLKDADGRSALERAREAGHMEIVSLLERARQFSNRVEE